LHSDIAIPDTVKAWPCGVKLSRGRIEVFHQPHIRLLLRDADAHYLAVRAYARAVPLGNIAGQCCQCVAERCSGASSQQFLQHSPNLFASVPVSYVCCLAHLRTSRNPVAHSPPN
jgi:hypothetical protein